MTEKLQRKNYEQLNTITHFYQKKDQKHQIKSTEKRREKKEKTQNDTI